MGKKDRHWDKVSAEVWLDFCNTDIARCLLEDLESLKQQNLDNAMKMPDKIANPNESITAFVNRAKGIQTVIDSMAARTALAKMDIEKRNKGEEDE